MQTKFIRPIPAVTTNLRCNMQTLALHGVPIGKETWKYIDLPMQHHQFAGLSTPEHRTDWSLTSFVQEVLPHIDENTVVIGHDFGGVVAAMCAAKTHPKAIILTGTALGRWWLLTRISAAPVLRLFFYEAFAGQLFVRYGHASPKGTLPNPPEYKDWPLRMRMLAQQMKPPPNLVNQIGCPVYLVWGRKDRWYPPFLAKRLSKQTKATLYWVDGGHYSMLENPKEFQSILETILAQLQ